MDDDTLRIVNDPYLSSDAVRLVLYVRGLGPGEHEISKDDLWALLRCRSNRPVWAARDLAIKRGHLRFREGGKAHSNRYEWVCKVAPLTVDRSAPVHSYPPVVVEGEMLEEQPPVVPLPVLHPDAERAFEQHDALFKGGRGSIRDYVRTFVPRDKQYAWVQSAAAKLQGVGVNWRTIPPEERPALFGAACNELAAQGEKDMKYPAGDPRNHTTKLNILVSSRLQRDRPEPVYERATGTDGPRRGRGPQPFDANEYKPTGWSGEFNG